MRSTLTIALATAAALIAPVLSGAAHRCPALQDQISKDSYSAQAVPEYSRKYNVDCTYCHISWPQSYRSGDKFCHRDDRTPFPVPPVPPAPGPATTKEPAVISTGRGQTLSAKSPQAVQTGKKIFQEMACATCHADGGNVINPSRLIKGNAFLRRYPENSQIAEVIRTGVPGTAMPAYSTDRLSDEKLNDLIAYVRSLTAGK